jgi:hypothetical protein
MVWRILLADVCDKEELTVDELLNRTPPETSALSEDYQTI